MMVRLRISGRVQGVAYRAWAEREAERLGLSGWVRNRRDGSVEMVLCGDSGDVEDMIARCHQGPRMARVDSVRQEAEDAALEPGFRQLPTV
jgi:acylphosphatase